MRISTLTSQLRVQNTVNNLQLQLATTQQQISTGKQSQVYSGLVGENARLSVDLREQVATRNSYLETITTSKLRVPILDNALVGITDIAQDFRQELLAQQPGLLEESAPAIQAFAQEAIDRLTGLLNTRVDGRYIFSGDALGTEPMIDPDTVNTAYSGGYPGLAAGAAAVLTTYTGTFFATDANWYQGGTVNAGERQFEVRIDEGVSVEFGEVGNNDAFEELLETLYAFANHDFATGLETQFQDMVDLARPRVEAAFTSINQMVSTLGVTHSRILDQETTHEEDIVLFETQIEDVEGVDDYEVVSRFQILQAQLEASYQATASLRSFSLARFI